MKMIRRYLITAFVVALYLFTAALFLLTAGYVLLYCTFPPRGF